MITQKGFTFIELLIVVILLTLLGLTAVPVYLDFYNRHQLDATATQIIQTLREAQAKAMANENNHNFGVFFATTTLKFFDLAEDVKNYTQPTTQSACQADLDCVMLPDNLDFGQLNIDTDNMITNGGFVVFSQQYGTSTDRLGNAAVIGTDNVSKINIRVKGTTTTDCPSRNLIQIRIMPLGIINKC